MALRKLVLYLTALVA